MRRKIIGRRADRRRHHQPVADQLLEPYLSVDHHPQLGRLVGLPKQRHFVDRQRIGNRAVGIAGGHLQRVEIILDRLRDALVQPLGREIIHQEADRAAVHPIDHLAAVHRVMQRLQHEAVAAQRHDDIGFGRGDMAIEANQFVAGSLRFVRIRGDERE